MKVLLHVVQTGALSIAIVLLLKIVSILRNAWLKKAIRMREKYNKKHDFHPENGIEEIDKNSLSYQIDSVEGAIAAVILFLIGGLLTLSIPISEAKLFSIIAIILSIVEFLYCWLARCKGTKKYRILVYAACFASLFLFAHALFCLLFDSILLVPYSNSINIILYIWSTMIMYRLIVDRKRKE